MKLPSRELPARTQPGGSARDRSAMTPREPCDHFTGHLPQFAPRQQLIARLVTDSVAVDLNPLEPASITCRHDSTPVCNAPRTPRGAA